MIRAVLRRAAAGVPILLAVAILVFLLADAAPGSPIDALLADRPVPPEVRERLEEAWGVDSPVAVRCLRWIGNVLAHGDLGWSSSRGMPVARVVETALPPTLLLGCAAVLAHVMAGLGAGLASARTRGGALDRAIGACTLALYAAPTFWLGVMAILFLSVVFPVFPPSSSRSIGSESWSLSARIVDRAWHVALPALVLGVGSAAGLARHVRAAMLRALSEPFCRAARARGASTGRVLLVHAFREAVPAAIAVTGLSLPFLVSGSLVVEVVFGWPGMGRVAYEAVRAEDLPLVAATTLLSSAAVVTANFLADVGLAAADPRARRAGAGA